MFFLNVFFFFISASKLLDRDDLGSPTEIDLTEIEDDDDLKSYVQRSKEIPIVYYGLPPAADPPLAPPLDPQPGTSKMTSDEPQLMNEVEESHLIGNQNCKFLKLQPLQYLLVFM